MGSRERWGWTLAAVLAVAMIIVVGVALAGALGGNEGSGGGDSGAQPVGGLAAKKATAVALGYVGGGRVQQVTRESDSGATYGVDVVKPDGSQIEVHLDNRYRVLGLDTSQVGDGGDGGD